MGAESTSDLYRGETENTEVFGVKYYTVHDSFWI